MSTDPDVARLRRFVAAMAALIERTPDPADRRGEAERLVAMLVGDDDWLPAAYAAADPNRYRQYLLYRDGAGRFSVVSFVWGPGQSTPIHDHHVWGIIGMLRGAEVAQAYARAEDGGLVAAGPPVRLEPGDTDYVSPATGDIHQVRNAFDDRTSISIHVYGGDIGTVSRSTYDARGNARPFVSGYSNDAPPDLRDPDLREMCADGV